MIQILSTKETEKERKPLGHHFKLFVYLFFGVGGGKLGGKTINALMEWWKEFLGMVFSSMLSYMENHMLSFNIINTLLNGEMCFWHCCYLLCSIW